MNPKITIIIPTYNREVLLRRALNSVPLSKDYQIIVIDDGSKDNSWQFIEDWYIKNRDKIHITSRPVRFYQNKGIARAMNTGFDMAQGEYIVSLSDDDYYIKDFGEFMPYLDGRNELVYFDLEINDGTIFHVDEKTKQEFVGAVKFIKRTFLGDIRIPELKYREDYPFSKKLYAKKPREVFTGIVLKHYNFPHEGSLTWQALKDDKKRSGKHEDEKTA